MGLFSYLGLFQPQQEFSLDGMRFEVSYSQSDTAKIRVDLISLPTVANALDIKSNDVVQLPLYLYVRTNNGRERLRSQLDYRLSQQPNSYQNASQFWKTTVMQAIVGECFILYRNGELTHLPFGRTIRYTTPAGEVRYAVLMSEQEKNAMGLPLNDPRIAEDFAYNEVLHVYESQDEYGNVIPLRVRFRAVLRLGSDMYSYSCNLLSRGGALAGYLSADSDIPTPKKEEITSAFKRLFKSATPTDGSDIKVSVLDRGLKFNVLNLSPQEMMLAEHRKDFKADVADIMHLPHWKVGLLENYKYASSEQAQSDYLQQSLNPLLVQIEREINTKLITDYERAFLYAEYARDKAIAIDSKTMSEVDDLAVKNGGMSINEWRSRRNLPAVEGGDFRAVPVAVTSAAFVEKAEALKLEGLALDNSIKAAQVNAPNISPVLTVPAPTTDDPEDDPEDDPTDPAPDPAPTGDDLAGLQQDYVQQLGNTPDANSVTSLVPSMMASIAKAFGRAPDALDGFSAAYIDSARKRIGDGAVNPAYEVNRALNAAAHESMRTVHGTKARAKWVGGANAGQVRSLGEAWSGNLKHPPLTADETGCFLVLDH